MASSSRFWYRSRSKFEFSQYLCNEAEIWHSEALISNSGQKSRYKYVLKEKKAEQLKFLPKRSLTKVLPCNTLGYC